jgi:hypothetical protein
MKSGRSIEVDVGERLPVGVADDEASVGLLGGPRWREWPLCGSRPPSLRGARWRLLGR